MPANDTIVEVSLSRGLVALIDAADAPLVLKFKWSAAWSGKKWYARRGVGGRSNHRHIYLHRFLMGASLGDVVDHINGNGLDCRRSNMRCGTVSQNAGNCGPRLRNRSGFRGVGWSAKEGKWIASIQYRGTKTRMGCFDDPEEAARAYDTKASELFGEFARLNFPGD